MNKCVVCHEPIRGRQTGTNRGPMHPECADRVLKPKPKRSSRSVGLRSHDSSRNEEER